MLICGGGESLKHISLHIDINAAADENINLDGYSMETRDKYPGTEIIEWKYRKYAGNECTELNKVPQGKHIIGLKSVKQGHMSSIINIIVYN